MSKENLKVTTSQLPQSRISVVLEVPADRCNSSFEDAIKKLSRTVNLPGFRKGKIPRAVILQQIGSIRIRASALESLLQKSWEEAIKDNEIQPLCEPELKEGFEQLLENFDPKNNLTITLETDIPPTPKLKSTKGLTAEIDKFEFDLKKVDELINQSRKQLATIIPVEKRAAKMGDIAVTSFKGKYKNSDKLIEGGESDSLEIELEDGRMIPGFIEGIVGMKINETKSINCKFPDDYHDKISAGEEALFEVTLKDLKERELPELDDSFAQKAGDVKNMEELRADLEKRLRDEAEKSHIKNKQDLLLEALVKELEIELPKTLIDIESRNIVEQTARNLSQQGIDVKNMFTQELVQSLIESSKNEAESNLKKNFALTALSKEENINVEENEINNKLKDLEGQISKEKNIDQEKLRQAIEDDLLQEKLIKWLEENSTVIETEPKTKEKKSSKDGKKSKTSKKNKSESSKKN